ncbi:MAG: helix-turn-helix domain-containing protein [Polyangia bacterium]
MRQDAAHRVAIAPSASTASALSALSVYDCDSDGPAVAIPRAEVHLVARFGPAARNGVDVHAFGARQRVHRKTIRRGQRTVTARLRLGVPAAVLGVPAAAITGRIVALDDLWGAAAVRRLYARLGDARDTADAAALLQSTIAQRLPAANDRPAGEQLALAAAARLTSADVNAVADELGVSERHLRRVFHDTVGVSPKAFAKLARFRRALRAARAEVHTQWAGIAAAAGYYDQAHLIADFRAIAGVTPRALLGELRTGRSIG